MVTSCIMQSAALPIKCTAQFCPPHEYSCDFGPKNSTTDEGKNAGLNDIKKDHVTGFKPDEKMENLPKISTKLQFDTLALRKLPAGMLRTKLAPKMEPRGSGPNWSKDILINRMRNSYSLNVDMFRPGEI